MLKGTRMLIGDEAKKYVDAIQTIRNTLIENGYSEVIVSNLCEQQVFVDKAGPEVLGQMYTFKDKGDREVCLIPEVTAVIQKTFNDDWSKHMKLPVRIFYVQRCYRYERPQAGRYREFTQIGIERLGKADGTEEVKDLLRKCLDKFPVEYRMNDSVKRGLNYYTEDGFEAEVEKLGAQKQIAGGGRYKEGIGWAIGLERLLLSY